MKKLFYFVSVAAFMASFASCGKIDQENTTTDEPAIETPSTDGTTTLTIAAGLPQTKTVWDNTKSIVKWSKDDIITVLAQGVSAKSSACASSVENENFTVTGWPADVVPQYAAFTGPDNSVYEDYKPKLGEDGRITVSVRNKQELYNKNSFGKVANVSIGELVAGENGTYSTVMRNVGGLIKFQLTVDAYSVEISDVNGDALAGTVAIKMTDGIPVVDELVSTNSKVTITSKIKDEIGVLKAGDRFMMACVLPGEFNFKVAIYNSAEEADAKTPTREFTAQSAVTINRNEIWDFGQFDNTPLTPPTPGEGGDDPVTPPSDDEDLVLTFDFASWPFSPELKTGSTSALEKTRDEYTFTYNGVDYAVEIFAPTNGYYYTGRALRFNSTGGGYLKTPAVAGMRLAEVSITINNGSGSKTVHISTTESETGSIGSVSPSFNNPTQSISLENTEVGTSYNLYTNSNHTQISKIVLTYTK